ncbi:MAG: hypothetical protein KF708_00345 [Pirellulales bacterium]|nr:hypothetical protein [Pirellulales bacterium]
MAVVRAAGTCGTATRPPGRRRGAATVALWAAIASAMFGVSATGDLQAGENPYRASTSRAAREDALASIPRHRLTAEQLRQVDTLIEKTSIFRRLPTQVIECDPEIYQYVMEHPEIVANIWQLLGIEKVVVRPVGPNVYQAEDGAGTKGVLHFLYRSPELHVIYAEGAYDGPMFTQNVTGGCLLILKTGYQREVDGKYYITSRVDTFIRLDNVGLEFLAKTFQPLVGRVVDYNFIATGSFVESLSRTAEMNPAGMQRLAAKLEHVDPAVRDEFVQITQDVAARAAAREERLSALPKGQAIRPTTRAQGR